MDSATANETHFWIVNQMLGTYTWPHGTPDLGEVKLVAKFVCDKLTPGDEDTSEARGVLSIRLMGCREFGKRFPSDGNYTYIERPVPIALLWEAEVVLQLPWGCCDDGAIVDIRYNPLGLSEQNAHDLVHTTGICEHLAGLIENKEKAQA